MPSDVRAAVKFALAGGVSRVNQRRRLRLERILAGQSGRKYERAKAAARLAIDSVFAEHGEAGLAALRELVNQ